MYAGVEVASLVYYKNGFSRILWSIRLLTICWQQKFYWDLMLAFCMRYVCSTTIFQYFTSSIYDFLNLRVFVIFCSSSINVYCWQVHTYMFSAFSRCLFNDNHRYYNLFFIFWWLCSEFVNVLNGLTSGTRGDITIIISFSNSFLLFLLIMIKRYCCSSTFEGVLLTVRLCITRNLIVNDIISFSAVREHVFYAIMNYENDLTDFSYSPQFFWCKQISSERFATAARLIICIQFFIFVFPPSVISRVVFFSRFDFFLKVFLSRQFCCRCLYHLIQNSIIKIRS